MTALALLDSPVVLAAQIWTLLLAHFAPGVFAPLALASRRLQGGGCYALGLLRHRLAIQNQNAVDCPGGARSPTPLLPDSPYDMRYPSDNAMQFPATPPHCARKPLAEPAR